MKPKARPPEVRGFRFAGVSAGLKKNRAPDLGLAVADTVAVAAGTFTQNAVRAAPVLLSQRRLRGHRAQGVIVNAGCANACTGPEGELDAAAMAARAAETVGVRSARMLVCSTGVIGTRLPMDRIDAAIPALVRALSPAGLGGFARAILTTDTFPKLSYAKGLVAGREVTVAGAAKGAGMIAPRMATMLAFVFTDAAVTGAYLRAAWRGVVEETFNRVTVDGDTSTNDTALVFASGAAGNAPLASERARGARVFAALLAQVAGELAEDIVRDGEGASRVVEVRVEGAASNAEAERIARRVAESPLVKTALYGGDANWGRILCAVGNAARHASPGSIDLHVGDVLLVSRGREVEGAEPRARRVMREKRYPLRVVLRGGRGQARMLTCDLTEGYIRVNAHYRS